MGNFQVIQAKLEEFIKRYYINELLKGAILFFAIGLLYFMATVFIEYVLWLNTTVRSILFWLFVLVELGLFYRFIAVPLAKLFKLQKGINYETASKIIGDHFPDVNDKLLNVLQLKGSNQESELLLASIDQKSTELTPIPFKLAINFKSNKKYLKYAAIPVVIILLSYISGKIDWFSDGYERVVNYKTAYEPPAPFSFFVINETLKAVQGEDFKIQVRTTGDVVPENVQINYNDETYYLQNTGSASFEYVFNKPEANISFTLNANDVKSKPYSIEIIEAPIVTDFQMLLDYPSYTSKKNEVIKSTGNAVIPEGTNVLWSVNARSTESIRLYSNDTVAFTKEGEVFKAKKQVLNNLNYSISTSNKFLKDYENLGFNLTVIKDEYPEINVRHQVDSTDNQTLYFHGQLSDDYAIRNLELIYYTTNNPKDTKIVKIPSSKSNFDEFYYVFPNNVVLEEGESYELFFRVTDNDQIHGGKSAKSRTFSFRKLTKDEEESQNLEQQSESIQELNKNLDVFEDQEKQLEELSKTQKEKKELNFNDKKKLENFLKRQKQQEEMMKNFNEEMQKNLEEFQQENIDDFQKEQLQQRLRDQEQQLQEDEKLLDELQQLQEKINREQFTEKLEQLAKQNKNQKRSLEQLLELTKRYYVGKKLEKLQQELEQLAKKQDELSKKSAEENTKEKQEELNKEFEDFEKELNELEKENKELKQPLDIPRDKLEEKSIEDTMKEAAEELEKQANQESQDGESQEQQDGEQGEPQEQQEQSPPNQNSQSAKQKQKDASRKMKKMAQQMQSAMQMSGGEQLSEDSEMLRQILDNLVLFSFKQEDLMNEFKGIDINHNQYASKLKRQSNLREHFAHVDDSLFALSLRQPMISEFVNKEVSNVFFNIDKSLNQISENQLYQGVATQQYTVTSANNLADFLSNILDQMQMQMNMMGSGSGQGTPSPGQGGSGEMQLPDIIMSQEELNKQMEEGLEKQGQNGEGQQGENGEQPKDGEGQGEQQGNGKNQGGEGQEGDNFNEDLNGELYQIYQQQQQLRQALENRLQKEGKGGIGGNLLKQMEQIELELLNKGFTQSTLQKMQLLKHQLLKLENASFQQGKDEKRESKTNLENFKNTTEELNQKIRDYFNNTEILNKQSLPLQPEYKKKVKDYFKQS